MHHLPIAACQTTARLGGLWQQPFVRFQSCNLFWAQPGSSTVSLSWSHSCSFLVIWQLSWGWMVHDGLSHVWSLSWDGCAGWVSPCDISSWVYLHRDGLGVPGAQNWKLQGLLRPCLDAIQCPPCFIGQSKSRYLLRFKRWAKTPLLDGKSCREFIFF